MADDEDLARIRQGAAVWNAWRALNPDRRVDLRLADLRETILSVAHLSGAELFSANLHAADLRQADLQGAQLLEAVLHGADLRQADLRGAFLGGANLGKANLCQADLRGADISRAFLGQADLRGANLGKTNLRLANLRQADLRGADLREATLHVAHLSGADLQGANLCGADISGATLIHTNLSNANLTGCRIYGISAWDLKLEGAKQLDLVITAPNQPEITVDNIEVGQFIYLLLHNDKVRGIVDTITSKVVLILGRFSKERKPVLDELREALRRRNMLPILFDFSIPATLDVTETVMVLAGLARFVIADVTDATEVRVELHKIIPEFTSLPVQPILLRGQPEFISLRHLQKFPWMLPTFEYENEDHLMANLEAHVIEPAIKKREKLIDA